MGVIQILCLDDDIFFKGLEYSRFGDFGGLGVIFREESINVIRR